MNQTKQILLAFFIPLTLAIGLLLLRIYVFYDPNLIYTESGVAYTPYEEYSTPTELDILAFLFFGMLILSFVLPFFVMMRTYQSRRNKLESASIIK